jgi:CRISPR/Cas system CSM-associated protein Csm3 (group 7 of RAMP superfamily)
MIITVLKVEIEADPGWAVGTADADAIGLDRELLTDPSGRPWVPPSSLAGSLRAHLAGHNADERLMGSRPPREDPQRRSDAPAVLNPSGLWLLGTQARRAQADNGSERNGRRTGAIADDGDSGDRQVRGTEVVANTAVDPVRRAARAQSLRHSRIVDEPALIELYAMLVGELSASDRELLAAWRPEIGRDRTRGGGTARVRSLGYRSYDLADPAGLRAWLEAAGPGRFTALTQIPGTSAPAPAVLQARFTIISALHIGTGSRREKVAVIRSRSGHPLVPASTWKGLFRARAGYIIRTCWGASTACRCQTGCGRCLLCDLFGSTARRGRLSFHDSTITGARREKRNHVAIDRISGGARDKLLFTDEVVTSGQVKLTITGLAPVAEWERILLLHVVRDIHDGLIGVGSGTQRGQGTLRLASLLDGCTCAWADLDGFHRDPPPADPPLTTHLWAWDAARLIRVRIDGGDGITAELRLSDTGQGDPVSVTGRKATSWLAGDGRVSAAPQWRDLTLRVYQVAGLMPLEFTRLEEPGPAPEPPA